MPGSALSRIQVRRDSELELREGSPRLPHGYFRMVLGVLFWNVAVQRQLTDELARARASQTLSP
jgi:hypothetical protein